jgi:AraC-like DNA-binding protein
MIFNLKMFDTNKNIIVNESEGYESVLNHSHDFIEITFIKSGIAFHQINDLHVEIKKGDIFLISTDAVHSIKPISQNDVFTLTNVLVNKSFFPEGINIKPEMVFKSKLFDYEKQVDLIRNEYKKDIYNEEILLMLIKNLINCFKIEILWELQSKNGKRRKQLYTDDYINMAISYIKEHYNEKIDVKDIADAVGLYPNYLQKLFREKHETSIMQYLQHYRVEKSCQYLIETNLSVEEIVTLVGINDVKNYYVYFKRYFNTTPRKFRVEHSAIFKKNNIINKGGF